MAGLFGLLLAVDLLVVGPVLALLWAQVLVKSAPAPWHLVAAAVAMLAVPWLLAWRLTRRLKRARVIPAGRRLLALLACGVLHAGALLGLKSGRLFKLSISISKRRPHSPYIGTQRAPSRTSAPGKAAFGQSGQKHAGIGGQASVAGR